MSSKLFASLEKRRALAAKRPHGNLQPRGMTALSDRNAQGRFGRMFPRLRPLDADDDALEALGAPNGPMAEIPDQPNDNPAIPAGFTYLGQFLDHDITFDPTSSLDRQNDPDALENFRTPRLDLDSVYGSGPEDAPYLYDANDPAKLLLGKTNAPQASAGGDLPRNAQNVALIGDPRNDENLLISQLHRVFLKFHNNLVDWFRNRGTASALTFAAAQQAARWHYQWAVVNDFLPRIAGRDVVEDVLDEGPKFYKHRRGFIPVEFSVAAYRFGHSMVREEYNFHLESSNRRFKKLTLGELFRFTRTDVTTAGPILEGEDWANFFDITPEVTPNASRLVDARLSPQLLDLPFIPPESGPRSLATRNLLRGESMGLPSGQAVARRMGIKPLTPAELQASLSVPLPRSLTRRTPLWYYILRESRVRSEGRHLGEVGGRIVAEVIIGLLLADKSSYLRARRMPSARLPRGLHDVADLHALARAEVMGESMGDPGQEATKDAPASLLRGATIERLDRFRRWRPFLPSEKSGQFTMADLIRFAHREI